MSASRGSSATDFLVRSVADVRSTEDGTGVRLTLRAVSYQHLDGPPGLVTGEPLEEQGLESALPNLPDLSGFPLDHRELELRITVPAPGVVRMIVAATGHPDLAENGTGLGIVTDPAPDPVTPAVAESESAVTVEGGGVRVVLDRHHFGITVSDASGRRVLRTVDRLRQCLGAPLAPSIGWSMRGTAPRTSIAFELAPGEDVTGFGEQFGGLVKNGQHLRLVQRDALGPNTGMAYKPVPVWHSSTGYTGFLNTGGVVEVDVGAHLPPVFSLDLDDPVLDLYLVLGDAPALRLERYTSLTGRIPTPPPPWAFGFWLGRCRYRTRDELEAAAAGMRAHDVPCDVLHIDPDWLELDRLNTDWRWSEEKYPGRTDMFAGLAADGFHVSVWELPYLDPASPEYEGARTDGHLVTEPDGEPAQVAGARTRDGRGRALIDFSREETRRWWADQHAPLVADGVAVFKTDFGEGLPDHCWRASGPHDRSRHNLYPLLYNRTVADGLARLTGERRLVWGRSGWAGSQRYPAQWAGDAESTVAGMYSTLRAGLSYAMCAPGLWSHDIGGFYGPELTPALYVRWAQFGALSPLARAHGIRPREPWQFGERALGIVRDWIRLRYSLIPYLHAVAAESAASGAPMLRPLWFAHPDDPTARRVEDQFTLGADLLVVPVFDDSDEPAQRTFYLPGGSWLDYSTGEALAGPAHHRRIVPLESMPVLVRRGAIIPTVEAAAHTALLDFDRTTLRVYGDTTDDTPVSLTAPGGGLYTVRRSGPDAVTVNGDAPALVEAQRIAPDGVVALRVERGR